MKDIGYDKEYWDNVWKKYKPKKYKQKKLYPSPYLKKLWNKGYIKYIKNITDNNTQDIADNNTQDIADNNTQDIETFDISEIKKYYKRYSQERNFLLKLYHTHLNEQRKQDRIQLLKKEEVIKDFKRHKPKPRRVKFNFAILKKDGDENMASLKENAQAYVPPQAKNIASLEKIPVGLDVKSETAKSKDGTEFTYKYIEVGGEKYRVPGAVLGGIKSVLKKYPEIQYVTVDKEGEGMNTKYHVMPWVDVKEEKV